MALKATIFKASLQVSDMDRNYYGEHSLTLARHPSETDERMMMRVLAFALNAHEGLEFGKGLSDTDEPDLWQKDLTGSIVSRKGRSGSAALRRRYRRKSPHWERGASVQAGLPVAQVSLRLTVRMNCDALRRSTAKYPCRSNCRAASGFTSRRLGSRRTERLFFERGLRCSIPAA
jgi:hypothetical protein